MTMKSFLLVTYDVKNDRRRNRIANQLKNYGTRVQYSVFECNLDRAREERLKKKIETLIDEKEDSVRYYRLCSACLGTVAIQGSGEITEDETVWIV